MCHENLFLAFNQITYEGVADTRICKLTPFVDVFYTRFRTYTQVTWIHQMQIARLKRSRTTFGYLFYLSLSCLQLVFIEFQTLAKCPICNTCMRLQNLVYVPSYKIY